MDWTKIKRIKPAATAPHGVYADLDELISIQFRARDFSFRPTQPVNSILSGRYASRLRGRGLNFEEIRQYQPGDDTRTLDWKVTARTRTPHVRVYTEEKDRSVLLLVDQRMNMFFGTRDKFKSVTAAELAALAAWRAVGVGDRVGTVVFNDSESVDIKPSRSRSTVMSILHQVQRMNHQLSASNPVAPDNAGLNEALESALRLATHDVLVIIISDFQGADEQTRHLVSRLSSHNDVLGLLVHDPFRINPPAAKMNVSDGDRQFEMDLAKTRLREKFVEDFALEQERIKYQLSKLSAPLLMISNEGDVVEQVRRLLGGDSGRQ